MKKIFFHIALLLVNVTAFAQTATDKIENLYGVIDRENLKVSPYDKWFIQGYKEYQPGAEIVRSIKKINTKDISIEIFFGTWCGDSRRELPRFLKVLEEFGLPAKNVKIIAVGGSDSLVKQSPGHEERGKGIFRVPTFIIYRNGIEINRINEFPVYSLEKDLLTIISNQNYVPNYKTFATIRSWLSDGTLLDKNNNIRGLAFQLRTLTANERELNSLGHLLLTQGKKEEALAILQMNSALYPESSIVMASLGEAYYENGDMKSAAQILERALELNKEPQQVKEIVNMLYKVRSVN